MPWLVFTATALADVVPINPIAEPPRQWQSWLIGAVVVALVVGGIVAWRSRS